MLYKDFISGCLKLKTRLINKLNVEYYKNILTIIIGVFFTQVLMVAISPFLTRVYSPESFGSIAVFLAITNIMTVVSTLRYENAIVLPSDNQKAINLLIFLIIVPTVFSGLVIGSLFIFGLDNISELFGFSHSIWLFFLPILILLNALFYAFRNYLGRLKKYKAITLGGVYKSVVLNAILVAGGLLTAKPVYFLIANIAAQFLETLYLAYKIFRIEGNLFKDYNRTVLKSTLKEYINFPKFSLIGDLLGVYTAQNAIILLTTLFSDSIVGFFSITQRVMGVPIKLISGSTLEVYKQKAAAEYTEYGNCVKTFVSTFKTLALIAIVPTLVIAIFSPTIFSFVFGEKWIVSGYFAQSLSIMFFFQFVSSPLGFTLLIANQQKVNLYWQFCLLIVTSAGIGIGYYYNSYELSILLFSVNYSLMYIVYLFLSYRAAKPKIILDE